MPDCYFLLGTDPQEAFDNVCDCIDERNKAGAQGTLEAFYFDQETGEAHVFIHYEQIGDANDQFAALEECLRGKGHSVPKSAVVTHADELGLQRGGSGSAA
jgi:hypothetical protein